MSLRLSPESRVARLTNDYSLPAQYRLDVGIGWFSETVRLTGFSLVPPEFKSES